MKTFSCAKGVLVVIAFSLSALLHAQKLSFNDKGEFKIMQFTDMHYSKGNPKSDTTLILIPKMLDAERPDLVIFSGDIVTGPVEGWSDITKFAIERENGIFVLNVDIPAGSGATVCLPDGSNEVRLTSGTHTLSCKL